MLIITTPSSSFPLPLSIPNTYPSLFTSSFFFVNKPLSSVSAACWNVDHRSCWLVLVQVIAAETSGFSGPIMPWRQHFHGISLSYGSYMLSVPFLWCSLSLRAGTHTDAPFRAQLSGSALWPVVSQCREMLLWPRLKVALTYGYKYKHVFYF